MLKVCITLCMLYYSGYVSSGTQSGTDCYCGNSHMKYGLASNDSECDTPCPGDNSQICGGNLRYSVYSTGYLGE